MCACVCVCACVRACGCVRVMSPSHSPMSGGSGPDEHKLGEGQHSSVCRLKGGRESCKSWKLCTVLFSQVRMCVHKMMWVVLMASCANLNTISVGSFQD